MFATCRATQAFISESRKTFRRHWTTFRNAPTPNGPADTFRGQRPWPKGSPAQEAKKEEWLSRIKEHSGTTDKDYAAAVTMLVDPLLPVDPDAARRLEAAGFVIVNPDGTCAAVDAW
jgi:hypothetical protein